MTILKLLRPHNSDGLINYLIPLWRDSMSSPSAARRASYSAPKVYVIQLSSTYKIQRHLDCFVSRDKVNRAAVRRSSLFFARHLDCFIMTRQLASIYQDLVPFRQIIVTRNLSSIYRDWQKTGHCDPSLALWAGSDGT